MWHRGEISVADEHFATGDHPGAARWATVLFPAARTALSDGRGCRSQRGLPRCRSAYSRRLLPDGWLEGSLPRCKHAGDRHLRVSRPISGGPAGTIREHVSCGTPGRGVHQRCAQWPFQRQTEDHRWRIAIRHDSRSVGGTRRGSAALTARRKPSNWRTGSFHDAFCSPAVTYTPADAEKPPPRRIRCIPLPAHPRIHCVGGRRMP